MLKTNYDKIVDVSKIATKEEGITIPEILELASNESLGKCNNDKIKKLLLIIDPQNDFMEEIGTLGVPGSKGDIERLTKFIYNNIENITQILCSKDTHSLGQIFHPSWWIDKNGNNPDPFITITSKSVADGLWKPVYSPKTSIEYLEGLETTCKKELCIWPFHCLEGTFGAQIESQLMNMIYFHSAARKSKPLFLHKGTSPATEMYGILKAEYDPGNSSFINSAILEKFVLFDEILLAGEAASHCLIVSLEQILEQFENQPEITQKITVLIDCTSCIPGYEDETDEKFKKLEKKYGIKIKKSNEI